MYQHLVSILIRGAYEKQFGNIGTQLIILADHALAMRNTDVAEQASEILVNTPLPHSYHGIGHYYKAMSVFHRGEYIIARAMLERVAESEATPIKYRARALESIGAVYHDTGNDDEALHYFLQAAYAASPRYGRDLVTVTLSQWMLSVIQSIDGDHNGALRNLEKLFPFVRLMTSDCPHYYYLYANALAVELGELGRIEEARHTSRLALASPFARVHPEWHETAKDISRKARRASRSVVAISRKRKAKAHHETSIQQAPPAIHEQVVEPDSNLLLFRRRPSFKPQPTLYSHIEATQNQLTLPQKRSLIVDIVCNLKEDSLDRLLAFATELDDQPPQSRRPRQINLEEKGALEMLMSLWTSGDLNINDHVAVLSALRDCDNDLRLKNIINEMITYIFRFTQERMQSEALWRKRVEAQLTPETD
ncbi:MAG: tetratricopeptide repeat protein [Blastocatellia bacterium]